MTITRRTPTDSGNTTYTVAAKTVTLPTGSAGDLAVIAVTIKPDTAADATIDQGFTLVRSATGGTGSQAIDGGTVKVNIFAKVLTGSEGTITLTPDTTNTSSWCHINFRYGTSVGSWANTIGASADWTATASDTNTASPTTASTTPTYKPIAGDVIEAVAIMPTDSGTGVPSTATITAAGLSGGSVTAGGGWAQSSTGQDCGMVNSYWTGFTGTATSTIAVSITNPSGTDGSGVIATFTPHEATAWTQSPADNLGLTDSIVLAQVPVPVDALGLTDSLAFALTQSPSDNLGLTDDHTETSGAAPPALVNQAVGQVTAANGTTFSYTATAGSLLVVFVGRSGGSATGVMTGVTDSSSQTWSLATRGAVSGSNYTRIECWYFPNTAAITSITLNSSTSQTLCWNVSEWSGIATSTPGDVMSADYSGGASSTTQTTPSITTTHNSDLVLAAIHYGQATGTLDTGTFTSLTNFDQGSTESSRAAYRVVSSTGNYNAAWTLGSAKTAGLITASFKGLASGAALTDTEANDLGLTDSLAFSLSQSDADTIGLTDSVAPTLNDCPVWYSNSSAAPNYVGGSSATQIILDKPTNTTTDDILVAVIHTEVNPAPTITQPGGWTQEGAAGGTGQSTTVFWKRAGGSEASTYTFTWTGGCYTTGIIHRFIGAANTGNPFNSDNIASMAGSTTISSVSYTANSTGLGVWIYDEFADGATITAPSGYTRRSMVSYGSLTVADRVDSSTGSKTTGTGTSTATQIQQVFAGVLTNIANYLITDTEANNLGLTDSLTFDLTQSPSDSLGLTDSCVPVVLAQSPADNLGLTDSRAFVLAQSPADNLGLTDSCAFVLAQSPADNLGLTDTVTPVSVFGQSPADNLGLTDSLIVVGPLIPVSWTYTYQKWIG